MSVFAFDLDGTLLECSVRQVAALHAALGDVYPQPELFWERKRSGMTTRQALVDLGMAEDEAAEVAGRWRVVVEHDEHLDLDTLLPSVEAALDAARELADRLVVITARQRADAVVAQCERLGLTRRIEEVLAVAPVGASENKAVILRGLKPIGFIGDTASDARAALAAGVPFAAVTTGQHTREVLARDVTGPIADDLETAIAALTRG